MNSIHSLHFSSVMFPNLQLPPPSPIPNLPCTWSSIPLTAPPPFTNIILTPQSIKSQRFHTFHFHSPCHSTFKCPIHLQATKSAINAIWGWVKMWSFTELYCVFQCVPSSVPCKWTHGASPKTILFPSRACLAVRFLRYELEKGLRAV